MWVTYADGHLVFNDLMVPDAVVWSIFVEASFSIRECGNFLGMPTFQVTAGQVQAPIFFHSAPASTSLSPQPVAPALSIVVPRGRGVAGPSSLKGAPPPPPKPPPPPLRQSPAIPAGVNHRGCTVLLAPCHWPPPYDVLAPGATGSADPAPDDATRTDDVWHDCASSTS